MTHVVMQYFAREIKKHGYDVPPKDISYSLGYCQGDGMSFTGSFLGHEMKDVCRRLFRGYGGKIFPIIRALTKGASIRINRIDHHYCHYNTVRIEGDDDATDTTPLEHECFIEFVKAVEEDVRDICKGLEKEGYAILEAFGYHGEEENVRTFRTKHFELRISELAEDSDIDFGDVDEQFYDDLIQEKLRIRHVKVEVFHLDENGEVIDEIGSSHLGEVCITNGAMDRSYGGYRQQMINEAISEARTAMGMQKGLKPDLAAA
ncbi:MAG: hypothetical protein ACYC9J_06980 [Sulfuricaulis sp.]